MPARGGNWSADSIQTVQIPYIDRSRTVATATLRFAATRGVGSKGSSRRKKREQSRESEKRRAVISVLRQSQSLSDDLSRFSSAVLLKVLHVVGPVVLEHGVDQVR